MLRQILSMKTLLLILLIFLAALLYSSVGHAGASGYLAMMALFGVAPEVMKPSALVLNILVASIGSVKFYRAGHLQWSRLLPFVITSAPFSFFGGAINLPGTLYKQIVGVILIFSAIRMVQTSLKPVEPVPTQATPIWAALLCGAGIGFLAGLTGTGGGIFLSPLLLLLGWAEVKDASGMSAGFILINSIAGLIGNLTKNISSIESLPSSIFLWLIAVAIGGYIGAEFGSKRLPNVRLRQLLAIVLVIAGFKLIFGK
ncbi:MAG: sulfite exporter TauE/SafE family protein [Acidobacteriota bacterium]